MKNIFKIVWKKEKKELNNQRIFGNLFKIKIKKG